MSNLVICPVCDGLGIIPVGKNARMCPTCKGNAKVPASKYAAMLERLSRVVK